MTPKTKLILLAVRNSVGVMLYVAGVSWLMMNGEMMLGSPRNMPAFLGPLFFLMLFVFSALVTSLLVFGLPVLHYLNGQKQDALRLLGYTVLAMFAEVVLVGAVIAVF